MQRESHADHDVDVNILYSIVSLAQQSPDPPFRALFAAYDIVLAENGIATEHDQIYFRYLLRLGEGPTAATNEGLVVKFRALLVRLGIHLVLGDDQGAAEEEAVEDAPAEDVAPRKRHDEGDVRQARRRVSFNDSNLDITWLSGGRLETDGPKAEARRRTSAEHEAHKSLPRNATGLNTSYRADSAAPLLKQSLRGRQSGKRAAAPRARSLSTQDSVRIIRGGSVESWVRRAHGGASGTEESEMDYLGSSPPQMPFTGHAPPMPLYHPSDTQMLSDADAFYSTTIIKTARKCLHRWHDESIRVQQTHKDLLQVAANYDRQTLTHQAISLWRTALNEKRQTVETERFFEHYERRASRARDLFLLNKAFTHWAQSASDQVVRTNVARRHILRTRYFNSWRDITVINELKCRRIGLRKWFAVWRTKLARKSIDDEKAVAVYEERLVEKTYWKWFWQFCERRAPVWKEARLKRAFLDRLSDHLVLSRDMNVMAQRTRDRNLLRKCLALLVARSQIVRVGNDRAVHFRQRNLLIGTLTEVRRYAQLSPITKRVSQVVSINLSAKVLSIWQLNTRMAGQAVLVDQQRILRNAWTSWNDNLRSKALRSKIDDRVVLQALYKWFLAGRLALFQRVQDHRLKQRIVQTLSLRLAAKKFQLDEASLMFQENQRHRLLQYVMLKLHGKTHIEEVQERQAIEFRNARAMRSILPQWRAKVEHIQSLNRWATDARFYCLTTFALRLWKEATSNAKRIRRRDAYATIRRRTKVTLVRNCLDTWRRKTARSQSMIAQADSAYRARLVTIGTAVLDTWIYQAAHSLDLHVRGEEIYRRHLFTITISRLSAEGQRVQQLRYNAEAFVVQSNEVLVADMLKRLKWSLFCRKRASENAVALAERNGVQHRRNMLRYWAEQARRRRASRVMVEEVDSPIKKVPAPTPVPAAVPPTPVTAKMQAVGSGTDLFRSLRLPSARKTASAPPPPASAQDEEHPDAALISEDEELDFGATHRAEEWTSFDIPIDVVLPTPDEDTVVPPSSQPPFATPLPGYLRTPSKRTTARQKARFRNLASTHKPGSAPPNLSGYEPRAGASLATTTPAPFRPSGLRDMEALTPQITPFERKMRAGGYSSRTPAGEPPVAPSFGKSMYGGPAPTFGKLPVAFGSSFVPPAGGEVRGGEGGGGGGLAATGRSVRFFEVDGHEKSS